MKKGETIFTMGNDAMTAGAIAAGARFYAGYPITPPPRWRSFPPCACPR
ncbi:MAG: hypothetical protein ACLU38_07595 [Dysosmobacter sp.]